MGLVGFIATLVVVFIVAGFMSNTDSYAMPKVRSTPESNVELIVQEITPQGIVFVFDSPMNRLYSYGYDYRLYVHNGQEWVFVPSLPGMEYRLIRDITYTIWMGATDPIERTWYWAGSLPGGKYKFSTSIRSAVWRHPIDPPRFEGWIRDNIIEHTFEVIFTIP